MLLPSGYIYNRIGMGSGVRCDYCHETFTGDVKVYTCPNGKIPVHKGGHDICQTCFKNKNVLFF